MKEKDKWLNWGLVHLQATDVALLNFKNNFVWSFSEQSCIWVTQECKKNLSGHRHIIFYWPLYIWVIWWLSLSLCCYNVATALPLQYYPVVNCPGFEVWNIHQKCSLQLPLSAGALVPLQHGCIFSWISCWQFFLCNKNNTTSKYIHSDPSEVLPFNNNFVTIKHTWCIFFTIS